MAGTNPFRRRNVLVEQPGSLRQAEDHGPADRAQVQKPVIDTDVAKPPKKTVRIISPHSASENEPRMPHELFSLPPEPVSSAQISPGSAQSSEESSPVDPFELESDDGGIITEDEDLRRNTLNNAGSLDGGLPAKSIIPLNPFPRPSKHRNGKTQSTIEPSKPDNKPHYSVDEFKDLLLTGRKAPVDVSFPPSHSISHGSHAHGDSSSNTDASSVSRQSIFEPLPGLQQDTPRSSHEISPAEDGRLRSTPISYSTTEKMKPSAPNSHHGKAMREDTQQAIASPNSLIGSPTHELTPGMPSPDLSRTPTDLNKPLPLPPTAEPVEAHATDSGMYSPRPQCNPEPGSPTRRREPPAPPLSRRQGHHRPKSLLESPGRAYGNSEASPVGTYQQSPVLSNKGEIPFGTKQPPPPPPRRPGPVRGLSESSSASAMSTIATPTSSSFTDDSMNNAQKQRPPVPPTRNRSTSSTKQSNRIASKSGSPSTPPTPPPRRRGSSQSSLGPFSFSADQQQIETRRHRSDSAASSIKSKDIMADLSTLQKEVDALRGKFRD
ncbi:MAG: hypothetical protein Q9195_003771 [Heterodermia aff. obscurata]